MKTCRFFHACRKSVLSGSNKCSRCADCPTDQENGSLGEKCRGTVGFNDGRSDSAVGERCVRLASVLECGYQPVDFGQLCLDPRLDCMALVPSFEGIDTLGVEACT